MSALTTTPVPAPATAAHVSDDELLLLLAGELIDADLGAVRAHLRECATCAARLAREARIDVALHDARHELFPPTQPDADGDEEGHAMTHAAAPFPRDVDARCDFCGVGLAPGAQECGACGRPVSVDTVGALPLAFSARRHGPALRPLLRAAALGIALVVAGIVVVGAAYAVLEERLSARGTVVVHVKGALSASVYLDGSGPVTAEPSATFEDVKAGVHTVVVDAPHTRAFTTTIELTAGTPRVELRAALERATWRGYVVTEPPGASLWIEDHDTGLRSPATIELQPEDAPRLFMKLDGYRTQSADARSGLNGDGFRIRRVLEPLTEAERARAAAR